MALASTHARSAAAGMPDRMTGVPPDVLDAAGLIEMFEGLGQSISVEQAGDIIKKGGWWGSLLDLGGGCGGRRAAPLTRSLV